MKKRPEKKARPHMAANKPRKRKASNKTPPFIQIPVALKLSPAWMSLSLNERRGLDRIEIEYASRWSTDGCNCNGDLAVTHRNFIAAGIHERLVKKMLDGLEDKGLIEVVERGVWNEGKDRRPSRFRLAYIDTADATYTSEWLDWTPPPKTVTRKLTPVKTTGKRNSRINANGMTAQ